MPKHTTATWTLLAQAVFDWAGALHQPVYTLRTMSQRKGRSTDWVRLQGTLRKQGFTVNDRSLVSAINATLLRFKSEEVPEPPPLPIIEDDANADWLVTLQKQRKAKDGTPTDADLSY